MDFLPLRMRTLTNLVTRRSWNLGSGRIFRLSALRRRGIWFSLAGTLGAVLGTALLATLHSHGVQGAANDVIAHAREVLHAAAADHHHRVLLEVVTYARDVRRDFDAVGQPDTRHLPQRRVRLLRSGGVNACTDSPFLG